MVVLGIITFANIMFVGKKEKKRKKKLKKNKIQ